MTTTEQIGLQNEALAARISTRRIGRRRITGAIATMALGLMVLVGGSISQGKPAGAAGSRAERNAAAVAPPSDASTSTTYRWNVEVYPSR